MSFERTMVGIVPNSNNTDVIMSMSAGWRQDPIGPPKVIVEIWDKVDDVSLEYDLTPEGAENLIRILQKAIKRAREE